jgi:hydrogenase-1 operon protein HyaF
VEWRETGIYGVWIGVFYDRDNKPILETVEISYFPKLASAQREDVQESINVLEERIRALLSPLEAERVPDQERGPHP